MNLHHYRFMCVRPADIRSDRHFVQRQVTALRLAATECWMIMSNIVTTRKKNIVRLNSLRTTVTVADATNNNLMIDFQLVCIKQYDCVAFALLPSIRFKRCSAANAQESIEWMWLLLLLLRRLPSTCRIQCYHQIAVDDRPQHGKTHRFSHRRQQQQIEPINDDTNVNVYIMGRN